MIRLEVDRVELAELEREILTRSLKAGTGAVHAATRRLERELEALTRSAVRGRAWRAWKSQVYPRRGGPAYDPVGMVFANGGSRSVGMLNYWTAPGVNRAKGNTYLAIPLPAALGTTLGRHISPRQWEIRFGTKLRPLFRPGKAPLLVADGAIGAGGFVKAERAAAKIRGGQNVRRLRTVAVFTLLDAQPHANRVAVAPAVQRARDYMVESFGRRLRLAMR